uniref:Uncharacterized protein n=1 Tax=Macaca fascicularis TaxID=9541 RepID=A0A7N9CIF6_MACFA
QGPQASCSENGKRARAGRRVQKRARVWSQEAASRGSAGLKPPCPGRGTDTRTSSGEAKDVDQEDQAVGHQRPHHLPPVQWVPHRRHHGDGVPAHLCVPHPGHPGRACPSQLCALQNLGLCFTTSFELKPRQKQDPGPGAERILRISQKSHFTLKVLWVVSEQMRPHLGELNTGGATLLPLSSRASGRCDTALTAGGFHISEGVP